MKLARVALPGPYPVDGSIVYGLVRKFAAGDIEGSLELAEKYSREVDKEKAEALSALGILDKWFENNPGSKEKILFTTRKAAANYLKLSIETLRTWERNGLFAIRRSESGRLLFSEWDIEKIKVIRLLRNCGYSIAALLNVFNKQKSDLKPSDLINLTGENNDIYYETDRYIDYLDDHKERARQILSLIKNK